MAPEETFLHSVRQRDAPTGPDLYGGGVTHPSEQDQGPFRDRQCLSGPSDQNQTVLLCLGRAPLRFRAEWPGSEPLSEAEAAWLLCPPPLMSIGSGAASRATSGALLAAGSTAADGDRAGRPGGAESSTDVAVASCRKVGGHGSSLDMLQVPQLACCCISRVESVRDNGDGPAEAADPLWTVLTESNTVSQEAGSRSPRQAPSWRPRSQGRQQTSQPRSDKTWHKYLRRYESCRTQGRSEPD